MEEKVFYPETIPDNSIPFTNFEGVGGAGQDKSSPETIKDVPVSFDFAKEVVSKSLNTLSNKIQGNYQFTKGGAIQIGEYQNGVSGEVKISPDGIVSRNLSGDTTFALDGTTGDATFKGSITANSVITGAVSVGNSNVVIDGANKRIIINDGITNRIVIGNV